ncbi:MAG: ferrochelatase [Thermoplasmata archaeon]
MNAKAPRERAELLMALGGPSALSEVEPYLRDLRGGRPTPRELVEEIMERYRRIGGGSPLMDVTRAQARALERRLAAVGHPARCEVGMRHWNPHIEESVARLVDEGVTDLTGLCLTPYYSAWSVGGYQSALRKAVEATGRAVRLRLVESWGHDPSLAAAFAGKIAHRLAALEERGARDPLVLFTAHSLPGIHDPTTEPYVVELGATRKAIEARLPSIRSRFAYQSVGRREGPWLGPSAEEELERAARAGEKAVLVAPFGFVSDNLEILYDVEIEMRDLAGQRGMMFERTESLNDDPLLVEVLARAVLSASHPSTDLSGDPRS